MQSVQNVSSGKYQSPEEGQAQVELWNTQGIGKCLGEHFLRVDSFHVGNRMSSK